MALRKVLYVTQFVSDQDKALEFYTTRLGLEKRADNPTPEGRFLTASNGSHDGLLVQGRTAGTGGTRRRLGAAGLPDWPCARSRSSPSAESSGRPALRCTARTARSSAPPRR